MNPQIPGAWRGEQVIHRCGESREVLFQCSDFILAPFRACDKAGWPKTLTFTLALALTLVHRLSERARARARARKELRGRLGLAPGLPHDIICARSVVFIIIPRT